MKNKWLTIFHDQGLIEALEALANDGYCPNLLNDDNGNFALVFDGYQTVVFGKRTDVDTSFHVPKAFWKATVTKAVEYALSKL